MLMHLNCTDEMFPIVFMIGFLEHLAKLGLQPNVCLWIY